MPDSPDFDLACMRRAMALAKKGEGAAEPNPMVGCVLARDGQVIAEGFHRRFGGRHAEAEALHALASQGADPRDATAYVTLEPCCHHGKTPPCSQALIDAQVKRVVVAMRDPFPKVDGGGFEQLRQAGIDVEVGLLEAEARDLNAPYLRRVVDGRPWVIAKWAMSLDGKIATASGDSQWISNQNSRREVHRLRGRVDAILVGRGTVEADDPLLTARPPGQRTATRIVCDSRASLSLSSQLCRTTGAAPVLVSCSAAAPQDRIDALRSAGCEAVVGSEDREQRVDELLGELAKRDFTNVMLEGGGQLLSSFWRRQLIDEAHVYIAPILIGGSAAPTPLDGQGADKLSDALNMRIVDTASFDGDIRIIARA